MHRQQVYRYEAGPPLRTSTAIPPGDWLDRAIGGLCCGSHQWLRNPRIDERAAGAHGPPRERLGTSVSDSGNVRARRRAGGVGVDTTFTPEDEELRAWLVDAGEAARQFLEVRAGETLTDPTDLEMRGHCEAVVAFDDGLRPDMTMAELADHFDEIQRLAEARADATLKGIRERADEARGTPN
jgi:hypothetical protein